MSREVIRILHVIGKMHRGGAETFIMNLYRNIDRSRIQFDFAVNTTEKSDYDDEILELGGKIIPHPKPSDGISAYKKELRKTLANNNYAGVHSHLYTFSGIVLSVAKNLGVKIRIAHSHNTQDSQKDSLIRNIYRWYTRELINHNATTLIGCSNDAFLSLFGYIKRDNRNNVIYNGINIDDFNMENYPNRGSLKEELLLSDDKVIIGHIGRFQEQKNHLFLIELFEELLNKIPNAHLILVGDGPLREKVMSYVDLKGLNNYVSFLGVRKDIPHLLNEFDLFLLPSLFEGLPVVLVEAQASGLNCVVSSNITSEVEIEKKLVHYVDLNAPKNEWINTIIRSINQRKLSYDKRYKALKKAGFDIKDISKKLETIYFGI